MSGGVPAGARLQDAVEAGTQGMAAGLQELKEELSEGFKELKHAMDERNSRTRQASRINEADWHAAKRAASALVIWAEGDPTLESLLGPQSAEGSAAWW